MFRLLTLIVTVSASAVATPPTTQRLPGEPTECEIRLKQLFDLRLMEPIAECGACLANVRKFVERMRAAKIPIQNANVLYVRRRDGRGFVPSAARGGEIRWRYHAVLEVNGKIYDLDYTKRPEPTPISVYFPVMFADALKGDEALRKSGAPTDFQIHVVTLPAEDVIREEGLPKLPEEYGEVPLVDYVKQLEKK